jgi:hypothetical protein
MPHKIKKSELVYDDYKWTAKADHDNPKYIGGTDHAELNRTEGYEMLYFMNSLIHTWGWTVGVNTRQTDPLPPEQCDPLRTLFQKSIN